MFDSAPDSSAPCPSGAPERMAMLRKTAEIGVRMAERLDRQSELAAVYAETCAVPEHLHPPYGRRLDEIARAIALAVALEDRIEADHRAGPEAAADRALKRELIAARLAAARPRDPAESAPQIGPAAEATAPRAPSPRGVAAPDLRPRLDRLANGGLANLDAWLKRAPDEVLAHIRRELRRVEAFEPPLAPQAPALPLTASPPERRPLPARPAVRSEPAPAQAPP